MQAMTSTVSTAQKQSMKQIGQGAEAVLYKDDGIVIKERIPKNYRLKQIDSKLRKFRTRRESKVLDTLSKLGFPAPKLIEMDDKEMRIDMDFLEGPKLRDVLHKHPLKYSRELGRKIAILHKNSIIHADLTTSNMIVSKDEIFFIDFGLSFFSTKVEDKAVDLHLLRQALESKHYKIWEECFKAALAEYKKHTTKSKEILERLDKVESRGRYKGK